MAVRRCGCAVGRTRPQLLARAPGRRELFRRRTAVRDLSERRAARARACTRARRRRADGAPGHLVALDFTDDWLHRAQHRFRWWWALHAPHHSQQKRSFRTDSRNHLLDSFSVDAAKAVVAPAIGVGPAQFVDLVVATRVRQSLQHANVGWTLGPLQRLLVGPVFHRRHHAVGIGHEGRRDGCNFAVLFPLWDRMFGTADYRRAIEPTGIRDQLAPPAGSGRDYGRGFWAQQWLGLKRLLNTLA